MYIGGIFHQTAKTRQRPENDLPHMHREDYVVRKAPHRRSL